MSHHSPLTTFDLKEKRLQLFIVVLLIIMLPVLLYLLQLALSFRGRAAGETRLLLVPRNVAQAPDGTWKFTKGQEVTVDVVLESGANQIETIEAVLFYPPGVVSLKNADPTQPSTGNIICSDFTPIKNKIAAVIGGLQVGQNGLEQGSETGFASVTCSIYPSSDPNSAETPPPVGFKAPIASFTFTPSQTAVNQAITIDYAPGVTQNDSSALKYEGACCSQNNVLQGVQNLAFDVVEPQVDATLGFSPSSGTVSVGQEFELQVNLSTGQYTVDSIDANIRYDPQDVEVVSVEEGVIFPSYSQTPVVAGVIDISGQINPASTQGLKGNNLLFANIRFKALRASTTDITFYTDPLNSRNDTNIVQFGQSVDVLSGVINSRFLIQPASTPTPTIPAPTPTPDPFPAELSLSPTGGNHVVGQQFTVSVNLNTSTNLVDSVDAEVSYDKRYLRIVSTTQGNDFESNSTIGSNPNDPSNISTVTFVNQISANSTGVTGTDLVLGTITFVPLQVVAQTPVSIVFINRGDRNDSNVVKFKTGIDLLGKVTNANFGIVSSASDLIQSIRFKIALQGRSDAQTSRQKALNIQFLGTYFETSPLKVQTAANGEVVVSTELESRLTRGRYAMRIKPHGYLQRKVDFTLDQAANVVDLTDRPFKAGDLDDSGFINSFDWTKFISVFGSSDDLADITGDGQINSFDNTYILLNWFGEDEL